MSLLFGAEFDAEMERGRQLQAGIRAEETLQLPPRDSRQSEKRQKKEDDDIQRGRSLRQEYAPGNPDAGSEEQHETNRNASRKR
jgi:membrane protein